VRYVPKVAKGVQLAGTFTESTWTSPLKIFEKRKRGHIQGLPKFLTYPLLSQERVKLRTSKGQSE